MKKKQTVVILLNMDFDIRQFVSSGIISRIIEECDVKLLLTPGRLEQVRKDLGGKVECFEMLYLSGTKFLKIKSSLDYFFSELFRLTYAKFHKRKNRTRRFHIETSLKKALEKGILPFLLQKIIIFLSIISSRSRLLRSFLRFLRLTYLTPDGYRDFFKKNNPSLVVTCSLGLGRDLFFMCEARKFGIPIFSIVQSWDKTSTKGCPQLVPDFVGVWNNIMAAEVEIWHDVSKEHIIVTGVPEWDNYFNKKNNYNRKEVLEEFYLDKNKKVIYFALCSLAFHIGNIDTVKYLIEFLDEHKFITESQLILRMHPNYYYESNKNECDELIFFLKTYENRDDVYVDFTSNMKEVGLSYNVSEDDLIKIKKIFSIADVCISVISTQMIEAAIFDKPTITVEYGEWNTRFIQTHMHKVEYEHLMRIYEKNSVLHARSKGQLLECINSCLSNPSRMKKERKALLDQEVPVNRGVATKKIAEHIIRLAKSNSK